MRARVLGMVLVASTAIAGGRHSSGLSFVPTTRPVDINPYFNSPYYRSPYGSPQRPVMPYYGYWYTLPQQPPAPEPAPPPPPQVIVIEREPAPPPPPPQVIVIQQPAPVVEAPPAPPPPLPPPPPAAPLGPRTPGPDVFQWTDDDGVVNYSTHPPATGKAKKLAPLAR